MKLLATLAFLLLLMTIKPLAQERHHKGPNQVTYPEVSKYASVSQTLGITNISIDYHRPKVYGRKLWGALIPYGRVWRAGANESTRIAVSDNIMVEGKVLPKGTYSIHMIPDEGTWTVIFSKNHTQWGSFYYDQKEDVLRVSVKAVSAPHQEALAYTFENLKDTTATLSMTWGKIKVPIQIGVNQNEIVLEEFRRNLQTLPRFRWFGNREAALYCVLNEVNFKEALGWIDRSLRFEENFSNLIVKADLLKLLGQTDEARLWEEKAQAKADTIDWIAYGYESMGHHGRIDKAISHFKRGINYYPESYILHRSLGDAYGKNGQIDLAKKSFDTAEKMATSTEEKTQVDDYRRRYYLID